MTEPQRVETELDDRSPEIIAAVRALVEQLGVSKDRRLAEELILAAVGLISDRPMRVDLKIARTAVAELGEAFHMFSPLIDIPKVTIFGSARTRSDDPLYVTARTVAEHLTTAGWMVITGAGPGIMQAAMEGAGRERSIGVSISLPFEQSANPVIAGDPKHVLMKYFFTRKLMLIKESRGFVCLPGGFGTLDELFELLTLTQTGKGVPNPIVLLDVPGDPYWETFHDFIQSHLARRGLISPADSGLYLVTDDPLVAAREIRRFYANYDSMRYVGDVLVLRLNHPPDDEQMAALNHRFGHLCAKGRIDRIEPMEPERRDNDRTELARIGFVFARHRYSELRSLIDMVNDFVPGDDLESPPPPHHGPPTSPLSS